MSQQKQGMSDSEIASRIKKSGSYIHLKPKQIVSIVSQLNPSEQPDCFYDAKTVEPLDKIMTAGIMAVHGLNTGDKPISKYTIQERRKVIKDAIGKNVGLKTFLESQGLLEKANLLKAKELPGDFKPAGFWNVLDKEYVKNIDLSDPEAKED